MKKTGLPAGTERVAEFQRRTLLTEQGGDRRSPLCPFHEQGAGGPGLPGEPDPE